MKLYQLFYKLFIINLFTFGGGYSIIPVINDEFVRTKLINEEDMNKYVSISQTLPGVMVISLSFLVGKKIKGNIGAFVSILASILPSFLLLSIITLFYKEFMKNEIIKVYLKNILPTVSAILFVTSLNMITKNFKQGKIIFIIIFTFTIYAKISNISMPLILIISSIFYLLYKLIGDKYAS